MAKKYGVIIGDIIKSKEIEKRKLVQRKFRNILKQINKKFAPYIISKFVITIGDEFQGVLRDLSRSHNLISEIQEAFYPIELRFGVGLGTITTPIHKEALGMDGPAFHVAREAIEEAKAKKRNVIFKTKKDEKDKLINTLTFCIQGIKKSWTFRQKQVVKLYKKHKNQKKVAVVLKIKQPAVAQTLSSANWEILSEIENTAQNLLRKSI